MAGRRVPGIERTKDGMAAASQAEQHGRGFGGIDRLAEHDVVQHDDGIAPNTACPGKRSRYSQGFLRAKRCTSSLGFSPGTGVSTTSGVATSKSTPSTRQEFLAAR